MKILLLPLVIASLALGHSPILRADDDLLPKPVLITDTNGWWQKVDKGTSETLHTNDGGKTWQNVTPEGVKRAVKQLPQDQVGNEFLAGLVCLEPLDAHRLWLAAPLNHEMMVAYTGDDGQHWWQGSVPVADDSVDLSFLDERCGYLLATSFPAGGHMDKQLFGTTDSGRHWEKLAVPKEGGYYVSGVYFRTPQEGWISGEYRGLRGVPIFRTNDGARNWTQVSLDIPEVVAKHKDFYANATPPAFSGPKREKGTLTIQFRQHTDQPYFTATAEYHSDDGGRTWHLPAVGVKTVPDE